MLRLRACSFNAHSCEWWWCCWWLEPPPPPASYCARACMQRARTSTLVELSARHWLTQSSRAYWLVRVLEHVRAHVKPFKLTTVSADPHYTGCSVLDWLSALLNNVLRFKRNTFLSHLRTTCPTPVLCEGHNLYKNICRRSAVPHDGWESQAVLRALWWNRRSSCNHW